MDKDTPSSAHGEGIEQRVPTSLTGVCSWRERAVDHVSNMTTNYFPYSMQKCCRML